MTGCTVGYVSGRKAGKPCPYRATYIVNDRSGAPFLVCGYHARGFTANALYPLDWSLATVRRWQRINLDAIEEAAK